MEYLEQLLPYLEMPIVQNAIGGGVLGPILARLVRGGSGTGFLTGVLGGIAAGYGADMQGYSTLISGEATEGLMVTLQNLAEGAGGGGVLGLISGIFLKRR